MNWCSKLIDHDDQAVFAERACDFSELDRERVPEAGLRGESSADWSWGPFAVKLCVEFIGSSGVACLPDVRKGTRPVSEVRIALSSNVWISERAERSARSRPTIALRWSLLVAVPSAALLFSACAKQQLVQASPKSEGVTVLSSELAGHIAQIAERSPTFRASWQKLHASGVPIRIGTDRQLGAELPSRYRKHPRNWTAVTLAKGSTGSLSHVVVALNENAMEIIAERAASGDNYMKDELDRVLIHEIYGHVVPVVEARDMSKGCPDALRPGESRSCVSIREAKIAAELGPLD